MFDLTKRELAVFKKLSTPIKIQDYLDSIPMNFERRGDTLYSPRRVLKEKKAHCFEGALFAAAALWLQGEKPLILDLLPESDTKGDDAHVVALYKRNARWGAISKTNHATIRFRDPVYRTIQELVLSYFHEWFLSSDGIKTLHSYSDPFDLRALGPGWITSTKDLWHIDKTLDALPHHFVVPKGNKRYIRRADAMERRAGAITEWPKKTA